MKEVRKYLATALELLIALGFVINMKKSATHPDQVLEFLGFVLKSNRMSIFLPKKKLRSLQRATSKLKYQGSWPVRQLAQVLGMMVRVPAPLHFRYLERARARTLRKGLAYETQLKVSYGMETDLIWCIEEAGRYNGRPIQIMHWDLTVETDASGLGWAPVVKEYKQGDGGPHWRNRNKSIIWSCLHPS